VQEIRWPIEGHKNAVTTLKRLKTAQTQLGLLLFFVLVAGCLSLVSVAVMPHPVFRWQYALAGMLSGVVASILMMQSLNLVSSTTGYELAQNKKLYLGMLSAGLVSGVIGDFTLLLKSRSRLKRKADTIDTPEIMESLP